MIRFVHIPWYHGKTNFCYQGYERTMYMKYALVVLFTAMLMTACGGNSGPNAAGTPNQNSNSQVQVKQTVPEKPQMVDKAAVSERLEKLALSVPQVKGANCVVIGNTAIVGIDVDPDLDRNRTDVVKYSVAEALRKDPHGVYAFVTADLDLGERIRDIGTSVKEGRPIAGFAEELIDIVGRIMPQIPRDLTPLGNGKQASSSHEQAGQEQAPASEAPQAK
jgi:YhcN/YlaJ family sporulation lipoprotein